jgi:hypothetical protein
MVVRKSAAVADNVRQPVYNPTEITRDKPDHQRDHRDKERERHNKREEE